MYLSGFNNHHQSEAIVGALPAKQNSPQQCSFGLYAEQLSGSAFTRPRQHNLHSWLYRMRPSVMHGDYQLYTPNMTDTIAPLQAPNPMRWSPFVKPMRSQDFIEGMFHIAANDHANAYLYQCNQSMINRYFSNHDGEFLLVPYAGKIRLCTEFGVMEIQPGMIGVIPRGITFKVELIDEFAAGYVCENRGTPFTLPELGPLGSNSLANPRHFLYPTAAIEERQGDIHLICKNQQQLWVASSDHSPLNVAAWHGNYAPYCYDLSLFNTINSVSFDHPDPSIFTVLTSVSSTLGVANIDFVIFPPRWLVAEHTFRPPYFHRNVMSELMGLVMGEYDAKATGFDVGGFSIHNAMTAHGPDAATYQKACHQQLTPNYFNNTLAFMFESSHSWNITQKALQHPAKQANYSQCWQDFDSAKIV